MEKKHWHLADIGTPELIDWLRKYNYPKPIDCPDTKCPLYRPACTLGVCVIASKRTCDF